ncbi:MAG: hypothetical protein WD059_12110 [Balneolaceae bacterium]
MRVFLAFITLLAFGWQNGHAQVNKWADSYQLERITAQMIAEISDIPVSVRRMAIYKLNYNSSSFDKQSIAYIKSEIESVFRDYSPVRVISPPELDPTDNLKIVGSDSTLQIMNIQGRSVADMSPELLENISSKYSVSGLVELTLQKKRPEGLIISVRIISPSSREIVWSKSFESYPVEEREKVDLGKRVTLNFGATSLTNESFTLAGSEEMEESKTLNYNFTFGYRQPLNLDNSSYLGLFVGYNKMRSTDNPDFENAFLEVGLSFDQALSRKSPDIRGYRVMLGVDASIWLPRDEKKGDIVMISPSIMFNLTENLGFEVNGLAFMSDRSVQDPVNSNIFTYGQLGYGVRAYVQF